MRITADTNILVRVLTEDDERQAPMAQRLLADATSIMIPVTVLCELFWVLRWGYEYSREDVVRAIRTLAATSKVRLDTMAVEAGLAQADAGGDFADGIVAYQGKWLGAEIYASFDEKACKLLEKQGYSVLKLK
ncbi:type II toxin-antitoxin system VapC family toxin [Croceibacterium ferulae]|uniref:type II toxin-antitoxin system VapC family toxin n=1 Tax=Croceibacterium ferulae TaxID=1854641 RepID=UPI000EB1EDD9|nr:type II toxin-antitoxin system VapC family toxin [Croceibacterium ferulae]